MNPERSLTAEWKKVSSLDLLLMMTRQRYQQAVCCISRRAFAIVINGRERKTKDRLGLSAQPLCLEKSGCSAVCVCECVWTLPEPRSKSYGDKSPRDTQTPPFTTEGSLFLACLPSPLTTNAEHRAIFSHSATKSIKAVIQRKVWRKGWLGWSSSGSGRVLDCVTPGISSHNRQGRAERNPFPFSPGLFLPTRRGWVNRDYESRREQSGQRDKSYLALKDWILSSRYRAMARAS